MALRRLKKDGLVRVQNSGEVSLTAAGRKIARKLTLRHHLIERMLAEIFGMEWYKVHDEAERLEHAVSTDFEAKLLAGSWAAEAPVLTAISANWRVPAAGGGEVCCCSPMPRPEADTGSAASTSATAACWSFWSSAASGLAHRFTSRGEMTTTH